MNVGKPATYSLTTSEPLQVTPVQLVHMSELAFQPSWLAHGVPSRMALSDGVSATACVQSAAARMPNAQQVTARSLQHITALIISAVLCKGRSTMCLDRCPRHKDLVDRLIGTAHISKLEQIVLADHTLASLYIPSCNFLEHSLSYLVPQVDVEHVVSNDRGIPLL